MQVIGEVAALRRILAGNRETALVPTMGNLHEGHLSLIRLAQTRGRPVVASIFVNPLQFGEGEDFEHYPRTLDADCRLLERAGCDMVFAPEAQQMYPEPQTFTVHPPLAGELCGTTRPGHFEGVCTVVLKLFEMVRPGVAVFGRKDYQQLFLIKAMARQFNLPIEILEGETVRAADGLALSSRNGYLTPAERAEAPRLYEQLSGVATALRSGRRAAAVLERNARQNLDRHGWTVEYVTVRSRTTLLPPTSDEASLVVLGAARLGSTRLIDNLDCDLS